MIAATVNSPFISRSAVNVLIWASSTLAMAFWGSGVSICMADAYLTSAMRSLRSMVDLATAPEG